jgi:lipid A 3-O-deacylase
LTIKSPIKYRIINSCAVASLFLGLVFSAGTVPAEEKSAEDVQDRYGLALTLGHAYDPTNINFYLLSGVGLYDYDKIWHHKAPDPLRFKVEYSMGMAREEKNYFMTSANIFALYYVDILGYDDFQPYVEGGIGIIYTGFQVEGQGLKVNFNPQMGLGAEFKTASRDTYFLSLRLHHLSNAHINHENRGVNSVILMFGRFF